MKRLAAGKEGATYDKGLIPSEHDDELDAEEFGKRFLPLQVVFGEAIKDKQTV